MNNQPNRLDITLVIPCYNESPHLKKSVADIFEVLGNTRYKYEIVFVDDCSQDNTREIIRKICSSDSRCRYIFNETNLGRGGAFKAGFASSTGRVTGFLDIDLEVHALYIPALVNEIENHGFDIATGHRFYLLTQTGHIFRDILSRNYRLLCKLVLGIGIKDSETGIKFFNRETTKSVILGSESNHWFWDTEVMTRACLMNLRICEMPVLFLRRSDKKSTIRLMPDIYQYLTQLFKFRKKIGISLINKSPLYWGSKMYDITMKILHGRQRLNIYEEMANLIPDNASVTDVCCGSCKLYKDFLKKKSCKYLGLDLNGSFVMEAHKLGINIKLFNLISEDVPNSDYVVICYSFYHFHSWENEIFDKLMSAAKKAVIISESVVHLPIPKGWFFKQVGKWLTYPGFGKNSYRYNIDSFSSFAEKHGVSNFIYKSGQRTAIAVFEKK